MANEVPEHREFKSILVQCGVSQKDLAVELRIREAELSRYLTGKNEIPEGVRSAILSLTTSPPSVKSDDHRPGRTRH
jgi:transcriptional regulator with XRE-family HTH domain